MKTLLILWAIAAYSVVLARVSYRLGRRHEFRTKRLGSTLYSAPRGICERR